MVLGLGERPLQNQRWERGFNGSWGRAVCPIFSGIDCECSGITMASVSIRLTSCFTHILHSPPQKKYESESVKQN